LRTFYLILVASLTAASCGASRSATSSSTYRLLGETTIPHDMLYNGTTVGGLSGIDRSPEGTWFIVSDDRSGKNPARFYTAEIDIDADGSVAFRPTSVDTIRDVTGKPFAMGAVDPESIRFDPENGTLWITSEGDETLLLDPFVREFSLDGTFIRQLPMPAMFHFEKGNANGPRGNGVFEAMTLSADGTQIIVSTEDAMKQDGPTISARNGGVVRMTFFDRVSGRPTRQIAYPVEPATRGAHDSIDAGNGVVEILARDKDHLFVVERAYTPGVGNTVRLYDADISGASNIATLKSTSGMTARQATKTLLVDFGAIGLKRLDNIEGIAYGPIINGKQTLVAVSDNNFNPQQLMQIVVLIER
ncbi:MAG: esterase-like activity of phytase family protein, partial [bacterium]|nr:esterase-like activity of phytase family protein [Candidatus Kapabacteria bacterium]